MSLPRQRGERELTDQRILGSGAFVESVLNEADSRTIRLNALKKAQQRSERVIVGICKKSGVSFTELRSGSRRGELQKKSIDKIKLFVVKGVRLTPDILAEFRSWAQADNY